MENECLDIVEGLAPFEMKEEKVHRVGAINIGALTTPNFWLQKPGEDDGDKPGPTGTLREPLRMSSLKGGPVGAVGEKSP
jgi:hypothetical protein